MGPYDHRYYAMCYDVENTADYITHMDYYSAINVLRGEQL